MMTALAVDRMRRRVVGQTVARQVAGQTVGRAGARVVEQVAE